jgi:polyribonucleotide nucleotidyltransferase
LTTPNSFKCELGGRNLIIETGKYAGQTNGAVTVTYGETVILVTACCAPEPREGIDFLPLTIDYEERLYAAGKIPGGFIRREGRPSQEATLASRLTDRPIRPLLPKAWRNEIQVVITVLSADQENDPDILAVIGGSASLMISDIPFEGPVSAVRVGYIKNALVLNPTLQQMESSQLDMVVASTKKAVIMLEAGAKEVAEDIMLQAIEFGHQANQAVIKLQEELQQAVGKPKMVAPEAKLNPELVAAITQAADSRIAEACKFKLRLQREQAMAVIRKELVQILGETYTPIEINTVFESRIKAVIRKSMLGEKRHIDGRPLTEIRPISCEIGLLKRTHGSGLFTRGQTQVLTITTLGSMSEKQQLDGLGIEEHKRFIHHYNMPGFSNGETKRIGTPGRREIGHGALVERAIAPVIPNETNFPYTIRLVSEVLSSSGSTSMASVCASSLSLMDAGIPIKAAVAGIAMGLVTGDNGEHIVLTDIEGIEDAYGDMDFKVVGTTGGITAMQLDIKLKGISMEIVTEAVRQAGEARMFILDKMQKIISTNRPELSPYAPRMYKIHIEPSKIGTVIGGGGKTIRAIIEETKTTIDIQDDGTVVIGSANEEAARKAIGIIEGLTKEIEIGTIYTGKVTRILNFGAMVEVLPGKEGLVHISELAEYRVAKVEDVVKIGDEVMVKVVGVDDLGRVNLSRKALLEKSGQAPGAEGQTSPDSPPRPRNNFPPRRDFRGGRGGR